MAFAEGFERGGRMAQGIIGTYRDANQRARERAAEEEIAALNAQYARSGEVIEAPQELGPITRPQVYAAPDIVPTGITRTNMQTGAQAPAATSRVTTTPFSGQTLGGAPAAPIAQPRAPSAGLSRSAPTPSTPPAQSQIYRNQADIYSRFGLTDDARRTRDLGLQAERDERRMATEQERYETGQATEQERYEQLRADRAEGLRREDTRNRMLDNRWWLQENRTVAAEERQERESLQTNAALNAITSGTSLSDAYKANPFANFSQLFNASEAVRGIDERNARNEAFTAFDDRRKLEEFANESIVDSIRAVAGGNPETATAIMEYYAAENEAQIQESANEAALLLSRMRTVNTPEKLSAVTKSVYNTDAPGDPEWVRASSLPQEVLRASGIPPATVATMWILKEGDLINTDAGVYFDTAGVSGWEFARDAAVNMLSGASPIEAAITMQNLQKAGTNVLTPEVAAKIFADATSAATDSAGRFNQDLFEDMLDQGADFARTGMVSTPGEEPEVDEGGNRVRDMLQNYNGAFNPQNTAPNAGSADSTRESIARVQRITEQVEEASAEIARLNARDPSGLNPEVNAEKAAITSRIPALNRERNTILIDLGLPQDTVLRGLQ